MGGDSGGAGLGWAVCFLVCVDLSDGKFSRLVSCSLILTGSNQFSHP